MSAGSRHPDQSTCVKGENDKQPTNQQAAPPRETKLFERSMNHVGKERVVSPFPPSVPFFYLAAVETGVSEF